MLSALDDPDGPPFDPDRLERVLVRGRRMRARRRAAAVAIAVGAVALPAAWVTADSDRGGRVVVTAGEGEGDAPVTDGAAATTSTTTAGSSVAGGRLAADLTPDFDSGVAGRSSAEWLGPAWHVSVWIESAAPGTPHVVLVQYELGGGAASEARPLCEFTTDGSGSGSCEGTLDRGDVPVFRVAVGGSDPRSNGYRTVAHGDYTPAPPP